MLLTWYWSQFHLFYIYTLPILILLFTTKYVQLLKINQKWYYILTNIFIGIWIYEYTFHKLPKINLSWKIWEETQFTLQWKLLIILLLTWILLNLPQHIKNFHTLLFLITFLSLIAISLIITTNIILFYLCIESISIIIYILVTITSSQESNLIQTKESAYKYLLTTAFSSTIIILGITIYYYITGTIIWDTIYWHSLISNSSITPIALASILFWISLLFKTAIIPFHFWAPDLYQSSSNYILITLITIPKVSLFFIILQLFPTFWNSLNPLSQNIFLLLSILSIFIATITTINQWSWKRLLAYSTIAQTGYIILYFITFTHIPIQPIFWYISIYILSLTLIIIIFTNLNTSTFNKEHLNNILNLSFHQKTYSFLFTISLLSIVSFPPLLGFFTKFWLFYLILTQNLILPLLLAMICTTLSIIYITHLIKLFYFQLPTDPKSFIILFHSLSPTSKLSTLNIYLIPFLSFFLIFGIFYQNLI